MSGSIVKLSVLLSANASQATSTLRQFAIDAQSSSMRAKQAFNGQSMRVDVSDGWRKGIETGESLSGMTSKVAAGFALAATAAAGYAAVVGVKTAAANEQAQVSFQTMLKSVSAAQKMIVDLQQFAATTPFEFSQVREGAQQMLAYGIAARDVLPMMRIIGDAASASPKGMAQGLESVTRAIGQMKGRGKVSSQEMLQLTEAGINAWEMLAKGIGKSVADTQKLVEDGAINSGTGIKALLEGMQQQFGGNMQAQSQTLLGQLSNLKDNFSMMAGEMAEDLMNVFNVKGIISDLSDFFGWVRSSWKSVMGKEDMSDPSQKLAKAQKMAAEEFMKKRGITNQSSDEFLRADWWKKNTANAKEMEDAIQKNLKALSSLSKGAVKDMDIVKDAISPAAKMFQDLRKELVKEIGEVGLTAKMKKIKHLQDQGGSTQQVKELQLLEAQKEAMEARHKMFEDGAKLLEDMRTPHEELNHEVAKLNNMLNAGAISWQTYERAISKANEKFREHDPLTKILSQSYKDLSERIEKASMTEDQLMQKRLSDAGGGFFAQVQLQAMQNLATQTEAQRKLKDEAEEANKHSLTGLAKYRAELEHIVELSKQGLKPEARDLKLKKAKDDLLNDLKQKNEITSPGLALAGSQEAYKAMVASTQVNPTKSEELKVAERMEKEAKEQTRTLGQINNNIAELRKKNGGTVMPPPPVAVIQG